MAHIEQSKVKELFDYLPEGRLIWKTNHNRVKAGTVAGYTRNCKGKNYRYIKIGTIKFQEHRLIWIWHNGTFQKPQIDHINGITDDNRIENLRNVTNRENSQNRKEHRKGKLVGTKYIKKYNKWVARVKVEGKDIQKGWFNTELEAHIKYIEILRLINESI